MGNFWSDRLQTPAPEQTRADGSAYREHMASISGSGIYRPPAPMASKSIYEDVPVRTLDDYASATPKSRLEQGNESDFAYLQRVASASTMHRLSERLSADEFARVQASVEAAKARLDDTAPTHEALRDQISGHTTGEGIGIAGSMSPTARAAIHGRWGGREIAAQGSLANTIEPDAMSRPLGMAEVNAIIAAREQERTQPQHTDVSSLRPTGSGFIGVDR